MRAQRARGVRGGAAFIVCNVGRYVARVGPRRLDTWQDRPQQRRGTSRVGIPMKVADRSLPHHPRRARDTRTI